MITLAAFVLLVCVQDKPCHALEIKYDSRHECIDAIKDLTQFWTKNMGEEPQIPMHCADENQEPT